MWVIGAFLGLEARRCAVALEWVCIIPAASLAFRSLRAARLAVEGGEAFR
jgi:hypothetical protein